MKSKYVVGWIILRIERSGKSAKLLRDLGWIRTNRAGVNNRHASDWMRCCVTQEQYRIIDWIKLAKSGLVGMAYWITDAQWGSGSSMTDLQWAERSFIDEEFNQKYPCGRATEKAA